MSDIYNATDIVKPGHHNVAPNVCGHPDDVLLDKRLNGQEKRALLASWASDANAVPHLPTLRQLPGGSMVKVEEILSALKTLDGAGDVTGFHRPKKPLWQWSFGRRRGRSLRIWPRTIRGSDSDDDPPPCPAYAAVRPRSGGGGAVAHLEPMMA